MDHHKEIYEYRRYTGPAELHKAVNTLQGIIAGITTDRYANEDEIHELSNWCANHDYLDHKHPFCELIPLVESVYEDGVVTKDEADDIIVNEVDFWDVLEDL